MPTIKEIARKAGVSIGTVSNVLNGMVPVSTERRERVLAAVRELDYHPNYVARSLKLRRTQMLGMAISDITNPFFPLLVRGAEDAALKHGYLLITFNTDDHVEREREILSVLRDRRVDGILLIVAPNNGDVSHIQKALADGIPIVCIDRIPPSVKVDSVAINNVRAARECVSHLLSLGHRRVAIITGPKKLKTAHDRLQGYLEALKTAHLRSDPDLILEGNFRSDSGYELGRRLLERADRPSAVFVSNGMMTLGFLRAMDEMGFECPRDIALASFDDLPLAPHLTAVAQPAYALGYEGAQLLIERIESEQPFTTPRSICLPAELKVRESTVGPTRKLVY
jgi:LacI family transcriptional regulator, galactose operon repressor